MEVASARKHPTIRRGYLNTPALFDGVGLDGEWEHYEFSQDKCDSESVQSRGYIMLVVGNR